MRHPCPSSKLCVQCMDVCPLIPTSYVYHLHPDASVCLPFNSSVHHNAKYLILCSFEERGGDPTFYYIL